MRFQFAEHPWISLLVIVLVTLPLIILASILGLSGFSHGMFYNVLTLFVIIPFVLHLPKGKRSFKDYLSDIRLTSVRPFVPLLLLALSCYLILMLSQATGSIVYRLFEGQPVTASFLRHVFDVSGDLPPNSMSLFDSIPSMFEEVAWRGVILTMFLSRYSERKAIIISASGFGLIHLINLLSGRELVWVVAQVAWAGILGVFYGYVFLKSASLLPPMIVHWLGNAFIGSFTDYIQASASVEIQALYGVVFTLGLVPTILMILWVRFLASKSRLASVRRS